MYGSEGDCEHESGREKIERGKLGPDNEHTDRCSVSLSRAHTWLQLTRILSIPRHGSKVELWTGGMQANTASETFRWAVIKGSHRGLAGRKMGEAGPSHGVWSHDPSQHAPRRALVCQASGPEDNLSSSQFLRCPPRVFSVVFSLNLLTDTLRWWLSRYVSYGVVVI